MCVELESHFVFTNCSAMLRHTDVFLPGFKSQNMTTICDLYMFIIIFGIIIHTFEIKSNLI